MRVEGSDILALYLSYIQYPEELQTERLPLTDIIVLSLTFNTKLAKSAEKGHGAGNCTIAQRLIERTENS